MPSIDPAHAPVLSGPWDKPRVERFLRSSIIPIRIATSGRSGPLVQSMWYVWDDGLLWCATQSSAVITARLSADPRCGFEVAGETMPYHGVRGQGSVRIDTALGPAVLEQLIHRYLGSSNSGLADWLRSRVEYEVALVISPGRLTSWDFRHRMQT